MVRQFNRQGYSAALAVCVAASAATAQTCATFGVPTRDIPSWYERALVTLTNAVRMGPQQYRDQYIGLSGFLLPATYPAVAPLRFDSALARAAHFHSVDMASTPCFSHNSCNGTPMSTRIQSYYGTGTVFVEHIAGGPATPIDALNAWLIDNTGTGPATDGSGQDLHRANVMSSLFLETGAGYAFSSTAIYHHYWTQIYGVAGGDPVLNCGPIYSGAHVFRNGTIEFLANYNDARLTAPALAQVVINGTATNMTLAMGTAIRGTYRVTQPVGTACRSYFFLFQDGLGQTWRYPAVGEFRTFGEGTCREDYRLQCVADVDDGSATGTPDGGVTIEDLLYYLNLFAQGSLAADIDDGSGNGIHDGGVTIDDLLYYLSRFAAGC